jgi:quercetin dioxygenase-like cupin family protein
VVRILITGIDDQGRSCVVEERHPQTGAFEAGGITVAKAAETESSPPPSRPPGGHGGLVRMGGQPGTAGWNLIEFPPHVETATHHTDSVDFDVVLEGSVELVLDDGPHRLGAGDGAVINGIDHSWRTTDSGCRMSVVAIVTPPLD